MERLTKTYSDGSFGVANNLPCGENSYTFKNLLIDRLGHYEDADEQGLLLRLPCKVGDTVYHPVKRHYIGLRSYNEPHIFEYKVKEISIMENRFGFYTNRSEYFDMQDIGKTVFLTKEEAEAKLKEMENKE